MTIKAIGYAVNHSFSRLKPMTFEREDAGADEVEVLYCGVCHATPMRRVSAAEASC